MLKGLSTESLFPELKSNSDRNISQLSLRLPKRLWQEIQKQAIDAGYGARGVNKYVVAQVEAFLERDIDDRNQIIRDISLIETTNNGIQTLRVDEDFRVKLWVTMMEAAWSGQFQEPPIYLEPSMGMVVRASLTMALDK